LVIAPRPRPEPLGVAQGRQPAHDLDQPLLHHVIGVGVTVERAGDEALHPGQLRREQLVERLAVAALGLAYQVGLRPRRGHAW
jgi:hypothetical protein